MYTIVDYIDIPSVTDFIEGGLKAHLVTPQLQNGRIHGVVNQAF